MKRMRFTHIGIRPIVIAVLSSLICASCPNREVPADDDIARALIDRATGQGEVMLKEVASARGDLGGVSTSQPVSPRTLKDGKLVLVASGDWTSGFFPGILWLLYEHTGDSKWSGQARKFTAEIIPEQWNGKTHDMGFKIYCSVGNGYRLTGNSTYREIIIQSARTLSTRFKPAAGIIRSWDHNRQKWDCPVIIDNLMNLELLFAATKLSGDSSFYKIAVSHARNTMKNHYREDYSAYHVVDYDTLTGKVIKKDTHQGYSAESAWSRGQAWGLYGYTMCYRETNDPVFLEHAEKIANFILGYHNLPDDLVPFWDFDAPDIPHEPRDASSASVMASALYELCNYSSQGRKYRKAADWIISNLYSHYLSPAGENSGFLLLHSTGSRPSNSEVDVPLIYADYYLLEALLRMEAKSDAVD